MPQTVLKKTAQKRSATARKPATSVTAKPASTSTRTATARRTKKAARPVSAAKPSDSTNDEEHFEWPPILRVRGKGNLTRKQIRQIVLEVRDEMAREEAADKGNARD